MARLVLLFLLPLVFATEYPFDPLGTHNTTSWIVGSFIPPETNAPMQLDIVTPVEDGVYPVYVFLPGFAADMPTMTYQDIIRHVACHGYVSVGVSRLEQIDFVKEAQILAEVFDWLTANLTLSFQEHNLTNVKPNLAQTALGGHSSGNHVTAQYLNSTCGYVSAVVMYDPVDGGAPYTNATTIINPPTPVPFVVPALQTANLMDPLPLFPNEPPCAPANLSNDHFYNAWSGPIWQFNATYYGHGDICDPPTADLFRAGFCPGNATDVSSYRQTLGGLTVSFFNSVFLRETQYLKYLTTPSLVPTVGTMKQNLHGYPSTTPAFCKRLS